MWFSNVFQDCFFFFLAQEVEEEDEDAWDDEAKDDIYGEKTPHNHEEPNLKSSDEEVNPDEPEDFEEQLKSQPCPPPVEPEECEGDKTKQQTKPKKDQQRDDKTEPDNEEKGKQSGQSGQNQEKDVNPNALKRSRSTLVALRRYG